MVAPVVESPVEQPIQNVIVEQPVVPDPTPVVEEPGKPKKKNNIVLIIILCVIIVALLGLCAFLLLKDNKKDNNTNTTTTSTTTTETTETTETTTTTEMTTTTTTKPIEIKYKTYEEKAELYNVIVSYLNGNIMGTKVTSRDGSPFKYESNPELEIPEDEFIQIDKDGNYLLKYDVDIDYSEDDNEYVVSVNTHNQGGYLELSSFFAYIYDKDYNPVVVDALISSEDGDYIYSEREANGKRTKVFKFLNNKKQYKEVPKVNNILYLDSRFLVVENTKGEFDIIDYKGKSLIENNNKYSTNNIFIGISEDNPKFEERLCITYFEKNAKSYFFDLNTFELVEESEYE